MTTSVYVPCAQGRSTPPGRVPGGAAAPASHSSSDPGDPPARITPPAEHDSGSPPPILPPFKEGSLLWRIGGLIRAMRPAQWVKNLFVLAPLVFSKHLNHPGIIVSAVGAFGVFCLLASAVYVMNDLVDLEADRVHPKKRHRPIAAGQVTIPMAKGLAVVLVTVGLAGAAVGPWQFLVTALGYLVLQIAYSFGLKKLAYVDVGCISLGFVLRVVAGSFAVRVAPSGYMLACTALLALFLGFGKRRHELASANAAKQRAALEQYSPRVLTTALAVTGFASVATYLAYTLDSGTMLLFRSEWLWVTTLHPLFGVLRFLQLVATRPKAESPTQEMLRDSPFMINLLLYVVEVIAIVYQLRPTG